MERKIVIYTINDIIPPQAAFLYARERTIGNEFAAVKVVDFYYEVPTIYLND